MAKKRSTDIPSGASFCGVQQCAGLVLTGPLQREDARRALETARTSLIPGQLPGAVPFLRRQLSLAEMGDML